MKKVIFSLVLWTVLFAGSAFADANIGRLFSDALEARSTGTVEEVSAKFAAASEASANPYQKSAILCLFSDYLMDHNQWNRVVALQQQILKQGESQNKAAPFYNLMVAYLELNQMEKAQAACAEFQACPSGTYLRQFSQDMKRSSPNSVHARVADLLAATPSPVPGVQETSISFLVEEKAPPHSFVALKPVMEMPPLPEDSADPSAKCESACHEPNVQPAQKTSKQVKIQVGAWNSGLGGRIQSKNTSIDLDSDVSLKRQTSPEISAEYALSERDRIKIAYMGFSHSGTMVHSVVFAKTTFGPGASFKLKSNFIDVEGFRKLNSGRRSTLGLLYGGVYNNSKLNMDQHVPGFHRVGSGDSEFWSPYIGLASLWQWGRNIGLEASIKGLSWSGNDRMKSHDFELKFLLGQAFEGSRSGSQWRGFLGYRDFKMDGALDSDSAEVSFSGPIFGLEFRF